MSVVFSELSLIISLQKQDTNHEKSNFCPEERWWFVSKIATSGKDCSKE
jgi:hypothetical protein